MFTVEEVGEIRNNLYTTPLDYFWLYARRERDFTEARKAFLWLLKHFLLEGRIKISEGGKMWNCPVVEQIRKINQILPTTEREMIKNQWGDAFARHKNSDSIGKANLEGFWFSSEDCPFKVMWKVGNIFEEGS